LDLGSVTNVMEEPAVELPLLTDPWSLQGGLILDSVRTWDQF